MKSLSTCHCNEVNSMSQSLLAQSQGELVTIDQSNIDDIDVATTPAYVGFGPEKGEKIAEYKELGVEPGQPYIKHDDGSIEPLKPFTFFLLDAWRGWVDTDDNYSVVGVVKQDPKDWASPYKQTVEAVMLVFTSRGLVPARATFRGPKCAGINVALQNYKAASKPTWGDISDAHAATMSLPYAFARFVTELATRKRTARKTGRPYYEAYGKSVPSTEGDVSMLSGCLSDADIKSKLDAVQAAYKRRVDELEEFCS